MSIRLMSLVWEHAPAEGRQLLVLLALADFSNDSGMSFPSIPTLAKKTRQSERNVQRSLRDFEESGLVKRVEDEDGFIRFFLNCKMLAGDKMSPPDTVLPVTPLAENLPALSPPGDKTGTLYKEEPSVNHQEPKPCADARHSEVKAIIKEGCEVNKVPFTWDGSEAKALSQWLKANPTLTTQAIRILICGRFNSEGLPVGERPRVWIPTMSKYAEGPLDRFGKVRKVRL